MGRGTPTAVSPAKTQRRLASARSLKLVVGIPRPIIPASQPQTVVPTDPAWSQEWGLAQIDAPAAWHLSSGSKPVVIAVVDSGVDPTQPDLQGALVPGADFADGSGDTADQYGHGTMVAGVIAARPNNGVGGAGVCWTCLVMPIKVLGAERQRHRCIDRRRDRLRGRPRSERDQHELRPQRAGRGRRVGARLRPCARRAARGGRGQHRQRHSDLPRRVSRA